MKTKFLALGALIAALGACGDEPPPPPAPTIAQIRIQADQGANPAPDGRASPASVFLYALQPGAPFATADPEALLGAGVADPQLQRIGQIVVAPGERKEATYRLQDTTAAIGAAVAFRQFDTAAWRALGPIGANATTAVTVTIGANDVRVASAEVAPADAAEGEGGGLLSDISDMLSEPAVDDLKTAKEVGSAAVDAAKTAQELSAPQTPQAPSGFGF